MMQNLFFLFALLIASASAFAPFGVAADRSRYVPIPWPPISASIAVLHPQSRICLPMTHTSLSFNYSYSRTICFAKHANDKAAKWAKSKRPRKSNPADINRKPVVYELTSIVKPAEFTVSSEPATSVAKSG